MVLDQSLVETCFHGGFKWQFIEEKIMERAVLVRNAEFSHSNDDLDRNVSAVVRQVNTKSLTKRFQDATKKSVEAIIERGRVLIDGKNQFEHGQFAVWLVRDLRFGERKVALRKAEMLMQLARNDIIGNACHWHDLPPSPRTLWELMQIHPKHRLLKLIADGTINSAMTREEAMMLKERGAKEPLPVPKLKLEIAVLTDVCIRLGGGDAVRAHLRRLKITPEVPDDEKLDGALHWVKRRLAKERGAN
jgi:hypothetical protein